MNTSLRSLDFSERLIHNLEKYGITTYDDIMEHRYDDFRSYKGIGWKQDAEIHDFLDRGKKEISCPDKSITDIPFSESTKKAFRKNNIKTLKDVLLLSESEIYKYVPKTRNDIHNIVKMICSGESIQSIRDRFAVSFGYDYDVIQLLKDKYRFRNTTLVEWMGVSKQRVSQVLDTKPRGLYQKWTGYEITPEELSIAKDLIGKHQTSGNGCWCFYGEPVIVVFPYKTGIRCYKIR